MNVHEYILLNLDKSKRVKSHASDEIVLPYPYNSPCSEGIFDDFYYWDTYFINKGLLLNKNFTQVKNNLLNYCFLINKIGFVPNANRVSMSNRSQMPLFIQMVKDYYDETQDIELVKNVIDSMLIEYAFWMKQRVVKFEGGSMNRYGNNADKQFKENFYDEYLCRVKNIEHSEFSRECIGDNALAECESGYDFSPRFNQNCLNFLPIDLNSLMYENEMTLIFFIKALGYKLSNYKYIEDNANFRLRFINENMKENGCFKDYNFIEKSYSSVVSAASFLPFGFGVNNDKNLFNNIYNKLNFEFGIATTEKVNSSNNYQWQYPNLWPSLVYFALLGAIKVKEDDKALDIAKKYLNMIDNEFKKTDALWEKYDVNTNRKSSILEYQETKMLGWTAGVYEVMHYYLETNKII